MNAPTVTRFAAVVLLLSIAPMAAAADSKVHMADGIKIGETDQDSATVWTRLTREPRAQHDRPYVFAARRPRRQGAR